MDTLEQRSISKSSVVVAALDAEIDPLRAVAPKNLTFLETGVGSENTKRSLQSFLSHNSPTVVWNIGFAGALSPSLQIGDLVVPRQVNGYPVDSEMLAHAERLHRNGLPFHFATAIQTPRILSKAEEKASLANFVFPDDLAFADLESAAVAEICAQNRISFFVVRCITDLFDENLPVDFNEFFDADGQLKFQKLLSVILLRPSSTFHLLEFRKRSRRCAKNLASFIQHFYFEETS